MQLSPGTTHPRGIALFVLVPAASVPQQGEAAGRIWSGILTTKSGLNQTLPHPLHTLVAARSAQLYDPLESLTSRVEVKLEGDFKGAVRLACSEDHIADMSEDTLAVRDQGSGDHI